jgi:peroxisomal coenzyme A diphosphatase NUDT7
MLLPNLRQYLNVRNRSILGHENCTKTAVMIPLVQEGNDWSILFEKRAMTLRRQAGEICFPGGHVESNDPDEQYTALRETSEELGVPESQIEILGPLDIFVPSSALMVSPYVGIVSKEQICPNPSEVEQVFTVNLSTLLTYHPKVYDILLVASPPPDFPYHLIPQGKNYPFREERRKQWFYEVDGWVIWGLTARILTHFLDVLRSAPYPIG